MGAIVRLKYVEGCGSFVVHAPARDPTKTARLTAATKLAPRMERDGNG
jgi:hypothetical protein